MAFKMKGWSPFTRKTDSDSGKTKVKEEKLATEDKAWDDLTETEKIRRQQSMKMLKEYNVSEREKREGGESALPSKKNRRRRKVEMRRKLKDVDKEIDPNNMPSEKDILAWPGFYRHPSYKK